MYNKLLERQLKRFIKNKDFIAPEWTALLDAINHSYEHYERDHLLGQHSLEICSRELHQNAADIQEREERIRAILEAASDGIIVVNESNHIEIYNSVAASKIKLDQADAQSFDITSVQISVHDSFGSLRKEILPLSEFLSKAERFTLYEISIHYPDGSILPVEISISDTSSISEKLRICILRDISTRKELERKINIRTEITSLLLESSSLEQAIPDLISRLCSEFGWDVGFFRLNDPQETLPAYTFQIEADPFLDTFVDHYRRVAFSIKDELRNNLWNFNEPHFSNHVKDELLERVKTLSNFGLSSYLLVPVSLQKNNFGIIELFSRKYMQKDDQLMQIFSTIGAEIGMFIERQQAISRKLELQKQLVEAAREAGMMQIATSVLHNVGNALNTLNTSISILNDNFINSEFNNLSKVAALIKEHLDDLPYFLTRDPKGKYLPDYFISLATWWNEENEKSLKEFEKLTRNIEHINKIISSQQRFSGISGFKENISVNDILDELVNLKVDECIRHSISINREYGELPPIEIDKVKLIQILLNLFCNAIDAVKQNNQKPKTITLKTEMYEKNRIQIHIIDNGCGIDPANIIKIFSYGFTTKKEGHGFGLHSSSLMAKEIQGDLQVRSLGLDEGAKFILTLPIN